MVGAKRALPVPSLRRPSTEERSQFAHPLDPAQRRRGFVLPAEAEFAVRVIAFLIYLGLCAPVAAEFREHTFLLDVHSGSARSTLVQRIAEGGYELSDGTPISFSGWYTPALPDISLIFLTEISEGFGISWGLSTGERGKKYRIAPALHVGFILQREVFPNAVLSLSATTKLGGRLSERTCTADYGVFGTAKVNCRLAASEMRPADTLSYLLNGRGRDESRVALRFSWRF